jgi:hypothetical protein
MDEEIKNSADLTPEECLVLQELFEEHKTLNSKPADYFSSLPKSLMASFYEKCSEQCLQVLSRGYKSWAYSKYRLDQNNDGYLILNQDLQEYLNLSSEKNNFVNLGEVFKNGAEKINRNLRNTIKRVLAANRETTVIDRLLRRIEEIVDAENSQFARTRGTKEDYFTLVNKFPDKRYPTNDEIEEVISKVGGFREDRVKVNAQQAPRIYDSETLKEMFYIICDTLKTEVTPNVLETIFLDLIPGYLPYDFVVEKSFMIYGKLKFPIELSKPKSIEDLLPDEQALCRDAVGLCVDKINKLEIGQQCKAIREHLSSRNLNIGSLARDPAFNNREQVEETIAQIGAIANELFSSMDENLAEICFSNIFENI